jgi:hypothetical protein
MPGLNASSLAVAGCGEATDATADGPPSARSAAAAKRAVARVESVIFASVLTLDP